MSRTKKKDKIVDPVFSKKIHKGTAATAAGVDYHYQKYSNIMEYLGIFLKQEREKGVYIFDGGVFSNLVNLNLNSLIIKPFTISKKKLIGQLKKSKKFRFCPLVLSVDLTDGGEYDSHANIMMIDNKKKTIELFEPHGSRTDSSELGDITAAYNKKLRILKKYFKELMADYKFINVVDYVKKTAFQILYDPDEHTGYCVTWSTLYAEYRILNPNISPETLAKYIDKKITTELLLKYSSKVEETLKST
tara:strand:+ start:2042 stop:2782 length:741 start_codon:yes stop_codon:yes gene_type:complete